jgi:hypothetical protein
MSWTAASLSGVTLEGTRERTLLRGRFPALPFAPGRYEATVSLEDLTRPGTYPDLMLNAFEIQLRGEPTTGSGAVLRPVGRFAP